MSRHQDLQNFVKTYRQARGWSQDELARQAGISRTEISAIEIRRLVPSVGTALALARVLDCQVSDLFTLPGDQPSNEEWAWSPSLPECRFWRAEVGGRSLLYPVEPTYLGTMAHDGVFRQGMVATHSKPPATSTLVMASCDPAVGILSSELAQTTQVRLLALKRSSSDALTLLAAGKVHLAGVHLAASDDPQGNAQLIRERLGTGFRLLHFARWNEGIALARNSRVNTVAGSLCSTSRLRWIAREPGSGARKCLDELLAGRSAPRKLARDHGGVTEAIRHGWADAGICLQLSAVDAGLDFLQVRTEPYDLCYRAEFESDARFQALLRVCRLSGFRQTLSELPGYDVSVMGQVESVE